MHVQVRGLLQCTNAQRGGRFQEKSPSPGALGLAVATWRGVYPAAASRAQGECAGGDLRAAGCPSSQDACSQLPDCAGPPCSFPSPPGSPRCSPGFFPKLRSEVPVSYFHRRGAEKHPRSRLGCQMPMTSGARQLMQTSEVMGSSVSTSQRHYRS